MSKRISRRNFLTSSTVLGFAAIPFNVAAVDYQEEDPVTLLTVRNQLGQKAWLMPAHFGPPAWVQPWPDPSVEAHYNDVTAITIRYLTDGDKLRQCLPNPYKLNGPPIVKVAYSMNSGITWLAGGQYNVIGLTVRANYLGEKDKVSGDYALVLWENLTDPILTGREIQGIPKIYGDIEDHRNFNGVMRTSLSSRGKTMLEIEAADLKEMEPAELERLRADGADGRLLGWKYIPNETGSHPIVSYATEFPITSQYSQAWLAKIPGRQSDCTGRQTPNEQFDQDVTFRIDPTELTSARTVLTLIVVISHVFFVGKPYEQRHSNRNRRPERYFSKYYQKYAAGDRNSLAGSGMRTIRVFH